MEALTSRGIAQRAEGGQGFGRLFTVLLFALFIVALLIAIMTGTGLYRALVEVRDQADDTRLATGLIANSVRAADSVDAVGAGKGPEGRSLVLTERLDSGTFETRIYLPGLHRGGVRAGRCGVHAGEGHPRRRLGALRVLLRERAAHRGDG